MSTLHAYSFSCRKKQRIFCFTLYMRKAQPSVSTFRHPKPPFTNSHTHTHTHTNRFQGGQCSKLRNQSGRLKDGFNSENSTQTTGVSLHTNTKDKLQHKQVQLRVLFKQRQREVLNSKVHHKMFLVPLPSG